MNETARSLIGRTLGGRFKLTSFIGEGAMASVFRGEQVDDKRQVAVKVMHRGLSADRSFLGRFQREARAAARIDHRNTVRILDHGRDRDAVYIAMELCSGQDLFEVLVRERRLPQARAVRIILQVCAALSAAHARGVVHRDLKPENVMLVPDPDRPGAELVKVLDFGIAKLLGKTGLREHSQILAAAEGGGDDEGEGEGEADDEGPPSRADSVITLVGTVIGTPEYMSPEQARGSPPVDARSDVYAAGVLLYQLVTGRLPFRGESPIEVILQHIERKPAAPTSLVPEIHPDLERVILKALAKWPAQRQQSAQELADQLEAVLPLLPGATLTAPEPRRPGDPPDEEAPTVRMLADEVWFGRESSPRVPPSRISTIPMLPLEDLPEPDPPREAPPRSAPRPSAAPATIAAPVLRPAPDTLEETSPWVARHALRRDARRGTRILASLRADSARLVGWWLVLLFFALATAVIWATRDLP